MTTEPDNVLSQPKPTPAISYDECMCIIGQADAAKCFPDYRLKNIVHLVTFYMTMHGMQLPR